ncbi:MAG: zinc ribbon domain-containing protein [Candidatus Methanoplasma sp.]|nr:zinc ribbon domain-containing protein [Candidatus Methanoplasma sp.]
MQRRSRPRHCHYCFRDGSSINELTMEQMIGRCVPSTLHEMSQTGARTKSEKQLPALKRWRHHSVKILI